MATSRAREINALELMWSRWRGSGPVWTRFSISSEREAAIAKGFAQQFAREMAEKIRETGVHFREHSRNAADGNEPTLARIMREKADSYDNASRLILDAAGITEGRDETGN